MLQSCTDAHKFRQKPAVNNWRIRINMLCSQVGTALPKNTASVEICDAELGVGGTRAAQLLGALLLTASFAKI